ncbi:MAG TPA: protein kinase [Planctomycetota bacterium]|nr:protein kinase [Planctomycetota bacterium]
MNPDEASAGTVIQQRDLPATWIDGSEPVPAPVEAPRRTLGHYELVRMIGQGGMGAVWEAIDQRLGRHVALKVMLREDEAPVDAIERFQREALHAAKLRHPNIIPVHDVGHERGRHYLVMDLVEGMTLDEALRARPVTHRAKAEVLGTVARAVHYAHEQGVIHRDLKPANIMLERGRPATRTRHRPTSTTASAPAAADDNLGQPLVMDFGLAKDLADTSALSRSGQAMGTPAYMPPEQADGRHDAIGPRSDVYSLGAILYEMLTGRPPFAGETPIQVMRAVVEVDPVPPSRLAAGVPRDLETICLTCLEKSPARRYPSAGALAADLEAWLSGEPIAARRTHWLERCARRARRHRAAWSAGAAAILVALAAIVGAVVMLERERRAAVVHARDIDRTLAEVRGEQARREAAEAERRRVDDERQRLEREKRREWQLVYSDDFSQPDVEQRWELMVVNGSAAVVDGRLRLDGGTPQVAMLRERFSGDLRIEWTCRQRGAILSDVTCFMASSAFASGKSPHGYLFQFGGCGNTLSRLLRDGEPLCSRKGAVLVEDRTYSAVAERIGGRLTLLVDGRRIVEHHDDVPLEDEDRGRLGFYGYSAETWIDDVAVWRLGEPHTVDVLEVVERHLERGRLVAPEDLINEALTSTDPARVARARSAARRAADLRLLHLRLDATAAAVRAHWPAARIELVDGRVAVDLSECAVRDLAPLAGLHCERLVCASNAITDLTPLSGMQLDHLDCASNGIVSLEPLRGMPLRRLRMNANRVVDLSPLAGMPLEELRAAGNRIVDLSPLAGMPLRWLHISMNPVSSLTPLAGLDLHMLSINDLAITDLEGLRGIRLERLECTDNGLSSLAPLANTMLLELDCSSNAITDLSPLAGVPLTKLVCDHNRITDLAVVAGMTLTSLSCDDNRIADLAPLAGLPLRHLSCAANGISDLSPLAGARLRTLCLADNLVRDLGPLAGMELAELDCARNRIADATPLAGQPLVSLDCSENAIGDLAPLSGSLQLELLWCDGNRIADLGPLAELPLTHLVCTANPLDGLAPLDRRPPLVFLFDEQAMSDDQSRRTRESCRSRHGLVGDGACTAARGDLRAAAVRHGDRWYARLPGMWTHQQAAIATRNLRARAPRPRDDAETRMLLAVARGGLWVADPATGTSTGAARAAAPDVAHHLGRVHGSWSIAPHTRYAFSFRAACVVCWDE